MSRRAVTLFAGDDRALAEAVGCLAYTNPFGERRVELEARVLGQERTHQRVWSRRAGARPGEHTERIGERVLGLLERLDDRLAQGLRPTGAEAGLYRDVVVYAAFHRLEAHLLAAVARAAAPGTIEAPCFDGFREELAARLTRAALPRPEPAEAAHLFAAMFQVQRAFHHIYYRIVGTSRPTARLRASIWESVFTHDMRRYERALHARLNDLPTLVTGPSGSGKDLVARAIAHSQYVPFDPKRRVFTGEVAEAYFPLNLAALSPALVESELFGHRRGAFTGALEDRVGWLEACPALGAVFLDEIGELDPLLQVKLLRVLQERSFQRVGETRLRTFRGKVIAATNRDLVALIASGRFREDLYYRLRADLVETPTLRERIVDSPEEVPALVRFIAERVAGTDEAASLTDEVLAWIARELPSDYPWPGNVRELEQCVRNVLVRGEYRPQTHRSPTAAAALAEQLHAGGLTADELVARYAALVHDTTRSYVETARRLGLDRRTVAKLVSAARGGERD